MQRVHASILHKLLIRFLRFRWRKLLVCTTSAVTLCRKLQEHQKNFYGNWGRADVKLKKLEYLTNVIRIGAAGDPEVADILKSLCHGANVEIFRCDLLVELAPT